MEIYNYLTYCFRKKLLSKNFTILPVVILALKVISLKIIKVLFFMITLNSVVILLIL